MDKELKDAIQEVLDKCKDENAKTYARAAIYLGMEGEELRVQVLYIRSNTQYWRGEDARRVKGVLDRFSKVTR